VKVSVSSQEEGEKDMIKSSPITFASAILTFAVVTGALPAFAYTGQQLAKNAKVTIAEARSIALKARPGKITDEELEKEKGGSGLRYSFDVKSGSVTYEVGVDAQTGHVLENKKEGPNPD
jgi:hypothetical protein